MITICFAVLICFFGLLNNTPSFLYSGYTEKINFANTYCTDACIFVNSDTNEAGSHILELEQFNCSLILDTNHLNFVKDDPIVQNNNELLVYISFQEKIDGVIEKLAKKANYSFSKELCRFKDQNLDETYIYKLSR